MRVKILITLILVSIKIFSQPYTRIFTNNSEWTLRYSDSIRIIRILGDTISNSKQYKVLSSMNGNFKMTHSYVREDSVARKCWILNKDKFSERILYDFNLNVSDTITLLNNFNLNPAQFFFTVDSICGGNCNKTYCEAVYAKSATIKSNLKILYFSGSSFAQTFQYIEGVGSIFGPVYLDDPIQCGDNIGNCVNSIPDLICCKKGSEIFYLKDCYKSCDTPLVFKSGGGGVNEYKPRQSGLIVNPNPANHEITFTNPTNFNITFKLIDTRGGLIFESKINSLQTINYNTADLTIGIYYILSSNSTVQKLIIEK